MKKFLLSAAMALALSAPISDANALTHTVDGITFQLSKVGGGELIQGVDYNYFAGDYDIPNGSICVRGGAVKVDSYTVDTTGQGYQTFQYTDPVNGGTRTIRLNGAMVFGLANPNDPVRSNRFYGLWKDYPGQQGFGTITYPNNEGYFAGVPYSGIPSDIDLGYGDQYNAALQLPVVVGPQQTFIVGKTNMRQEGNTLRAILWSVPESSGVAKSGLLSYGKVVGVPANKVAICGQHLEPGITRVDDQRTWDNPVSEITNFVNIMPHVPEVLTTLMGPPSYITHLNTALKRPGATVSHWGSRAWEPTETFAGAVGYRRFNDYGQAVLEKVVRKYILGFTPHSEVSLTNKINNMRDIARIGLDELSAQIFAESLTLSNGNLERIDGRTAHGGQIQGRPIAMVLTGTLFNDNRFYKLRGMTGQLRTVLDNVSWNEFTTDPYDVKYKFDPSYAAANYVPDTMFGYTTPQINSLVGPIPGGTYAFCCTLKEHFITASLLKYLNHAFPIYANVDPDCVWRTAVKKYADARVGQQDWNIDALSAWSSWTNFTEGCPGTGGASFASGGSQSSSGTSGDSDTATNSNKSLTPAVVTTSSAASSLATAAAAPDSPFRPMTKEERKAVIEKARIDAGEIPRPNKNGNVPDAKTKKVSVKSGKIQDKK